jgi:hypothetical protein
MTMVSASRVARLAERLLEIFNEAGVPDPVPHKGVMEGALSIWEILGTLRNNPNLADPTVEAMYVASAGLHDLCAKIVTVWHGFPIQHQQLLPHLRLLARSYHVGQNSMNERWEVVDGKARDLGDADKVIELYWACLCILLGANVTLDDPDHSSGGNNPDVLATMSDGTVWAFALKTLASTCADNVSKNLAGLIASGHQQIARSSCFKGIVVVNCKNVLQHGSLRLLRYTSAEDAAAAIGTQLDAIRNVFWERDATLLPVESIVSPKVAPLAILVAHATVLCTPEGRESYSPSEIKVSKVLTLPNQFDAKTNPATSDALTLAEALNDKIQSVI